MVAELHSYGRVAPYQRHTKRNPCLICKGGNNDKRGRGIRCSGYTSDDGRWCFCTREEYAGGLPLRLTEPPSYMHKLDGPCNCGEDHAAPYRLEALSSSHSSRSTAAAETSVTHKPPTRSHLRHTPTAIYDYGDGLRKLRFERADGSGKWFVWQHHDTAGDWLDGRDRIPDAYRAETLAAAGMLEPVFIPEGEKCADAIVRVGGVAISAADGAGSWRTEYREHLRGRHVVILADADEPGRAHAAEVAADCSTVAASVRVLELEGVHDVADWLADGHTFVELLKIVAATPVKSDMNFTASPTEEAPDDIARLRAENATLHTQVASMNEKLLWIFDVLAVPQERMNHSEKCLLIATRRNAEWSVNAPQDGESDKSKEMRAKGFTPAYLESLGRETGMSSGTAGKNLKTLKSMGALVTEPFTETKTVPIIETETDRETGEIKKKVVGEEVKVISRLAYTVGPTIRQPHVWMPEGGPRENRGGKREGAGRPKKCTKPGCGSEEFTSEHIYREVTSHIVRESRCAKCGTPHREVLSDSEHVESREEIADEKVEREIKVEFSSQDSYQRKVDGHADDAKPGMNHHDERAEVLVLAKTLDWPRIPIAPGTIIGGTAEHWRTFAHGARNEHIDDALRSLRMRASALHGEGVNAYASIAAG